MITKNNEERMKKLIADYMAIARSSNTNEIDRKDAVKDCSEAIANILCFALNHCGGFNLEDFCKAMDTQHRTIQQMAMGLFLTWCKHCSSPDYDFDDRNQATHEIAKDIMAAVKGQTSLPFI